MIRRHQGVSLCRFTHPRKVIICRTQKEGKARHLKRCYYNVDEGVWRSMYAGGAALAKKDFGRFHRNLARKGVTEICKALKEQGRVEFAYLDIQGREIDRDVIVMNPVERCPECGGILQHMFRGDAACTSCDYFDRWSLGKHRIDYVQRRL